MKNKTIEEFIEQANKVHGNKYCYDKSKYVGVFVSVIIICPRHGEFNQTPDNHLRGKGCGKCGVEERADKLRSNAIEFIEKANKIHNNKYFYGGVLYKSAIINVIIGCLKHGDFKQTPNGHLCGHGCPKCSIEESAEKRRSNAEEFIKKARVVHCNKYIYDSLVYIDSQTKVIIGCPKHGDFEQTPNNHLHGYGCSKCVLTISYISCRWLDSLGIPDDTEHREVKKLIPCRRFSVDGFMPETNTVYEFYGDEVHGNPNLYSPDDRSRFGRTYREAYEKTTEREEIFKAAGFNLVTIWESDYKKQLIQEFVENQSRNALKKAG